MAWSEGLEKSWGLIWIRSCIVVCVWISDFTLGHEEVVIRMGIEALERTYSDRPYDWDCFHRAHDATESIWHKATFQGKTYENEHSCGVWGFMSVSGLRSSPRHVRRSCRVAAEVRAELCIF